MKTSRTIPKAHAPRPAGAGGYKIVAFPKQFEKNIWEGIDRRFYTVLLVSFIFVYSIVIYFANTEYSKEYIEDQIKRKYLQKFYEAELVEEHIVEEGEDAGGGAADEGEEEKEDERAKRDEGKRAEATGPSAAERRSMRRQAAAQRGRQRASMDQAVAGTGVLAELSAGGGGGTGDAVFDALGEAGSGGFGNLDKVLGEVGGLQTASSGSRRSKLGARSGGQTRGAVGIDDLIEGGIGQSGSVSINRRGSFSIKMEKGSVSGKGSKSAYRSSDAISRIVNKHADAIENCYKKEARINPNLKGSITVQWTIMYNGKVTKARVLKSDLRNKKVEACIVRRIKSWRFKQITKKEGDVSFRQKYIFSS